MNLVRWMATPVGRLARMLVGALLVWAGARLGGSGGLVLVVVGAVPFLAGLLNVCLVGPFFGAGFRGGARHAH
jgi:hypothetical protein